MSRQINFFADQVDTDLLNQHILQLFPDLTIVKSNRGPWDDQQPRSISNADELKQHDLTLLVPDWAYDSLHYEPLEKLYPDAEWARNQFIVNDELCPVIQYRPCKGNTDDGPICRGRLYWDYKGDISAEHQEEVDSLFLWVKKQTKPADAISRVFPHSSKAARLLESPGFAGLSRFSHVGIFQRRDERHRKDVQQSLRRQHGGQKDKLIMLTNGKYRIADLEDSAGGLHLIGD